MRERAVMDGQLMDPQLRLGAVNVPVDSFSLDAEDMTMLEVGVVQEFAPGDSRRLSRRQMELSATAMDATALDRERTVRREVRKLWTQLGYVGAARELLGDQVDWVEQMRRSARARYASGEGSQLDLLQAGLDAAMLREQHLDLDRDDAMTARSCRSGSAPTTRRARSRPACRRASSWRRSRRSSTPRRASGAGRLRAAHRCRAHGDRDCPRAAQAGVDARRELRVPPRTSPRHVATRHAERDGDRRTAAVSRQPAGPRGERGEARDAAGTARAARGSSPRDAGHARGGLGTSPTAPRNSSASTRPTCCRWPSSRCRRRCSPGVPIA